MSDARKLYDFIKYLEEFKTLQRFVGQTYWKEYPFPQRYESNADHTWRMAMILVLLEQYLSQPFDLTRAMKMLLLHDVPELVADDPSPLGKSGTGKDSHAFNKKKAEEKSKNEQAAAREIFSKLPQPLGDELLALWQEYNDKSTYEARVVSAIDKFEGKLQAVEYSKGNLYKDHYDFTMKYGVDSWNADPITQELGNMLLQELSDIYTEFTPPKTK